MCLIISNPECRKIPVDHIVNAYRTNHDGFGLMWAFNGKLRTVKSEKYSLPKIIELFEQIEEVQVPYVAHFRFATHGSRNFNNCHPFTISENAAGGIAMMHNGTLLGNKWRNNQKSDTWLLSEEISMGLRYGELDVEDIFEKDVPLLSHHYGKDLGSDKLVFMNGQGDISYVNEGRGFWMNGSWYSNLYSIGQWTASEAWEWADD